MAEYSATTQYDNYKLRLRVSEDSYDVGSNSSSLSWNLYIINNGHRFNIGNFWHTVSINGIQVDNFNGACNTTDVSASGGEHYLASGTMTVYHENDGTKTVYCYADCNGRSNGYGPGWGACDGHLTLTTIPRAPVYTSINASSVTESSVRLTGSIDTKGLPITDGGWDLSTNGGSSWTYYSGGPTDRTITGLSPGTTYWYRGYVVTAGGGSNSGWSTFTTWAYARITSHYVSSVTEHTVSVTWAADVSCNAVQYSLNGGSWVSTQGTTYTISGLNPGTQYSIKTRVKRADNGLWTESGVIYGTTNNCVVKNKINGVWKNCVPYVKINGTWKKAIPYIKVNGIWKEGIN